MSPFGLVVDLLFPTNRKLQMYSSPSTHQLITQPKARTGYISPPTAKIKCYISEIFIFIIFRRDAARRVVREYEVSDLHLIKLSGSCCVEVFYKTNCLGRSQFLPSGFLGSANFHRVRSFQPANCDHVWQDFLGYL